MNLIHMIIITRALRSLFAVLIMVLAGCSTVPTSYQPVQPIAPLDFFDRAFDEVLRAHVMDGVVDYPGIATDSRFTSYLEQLRRVDPNALPTQAERLIFWTNAYNAFAIRGILDGYSPRTLFGRYRYFIARKYNVGGELIDLYDIEQKILIPQFHEPRIHFAIVCASSSCPKLQPHAYKADQLEAQLEYSAREFINDPTRNHFDREKKIAYLSMIFKWFEKDFVAQQGSLLSYVQHYVNDPDLKRELASESYTVKFIDYDLNLNGTPYVYPH